MKLPDRVDDVSARFLSVVVCCYNEAHVLPEFHRRLMLALHRLPVRYEVLYVNDGSVDDSLAILEQLCRAPLVRCLNLSRNFGKESAMAAGIDHAWGEAILFIDADLQDPPELIPSMVRHWLAGCDIVNMQRHHRRGDTFGKRISALLYYRLLRVLVDKYAVPQDVSDFRLIGAAPLNALRAMPERARFMKGMINWLGFKTVELPYDRMARGGGQSKWGPLALVDLAIEGIVAFSRKPLRWFSLLSALVFGLTLLYIAGQLSTGSLNAHDLILGMGAMLALGIALIGEYIGATLSEVKRRPVYLLSSTFGGLARQLKAPAESAPPVSALEERENR
ncbi:glycosyltransferase family 2 protein [Pseudomonas chlororaphis]|uniref:Glycosyltransferase n=1 Tax=Pseudomonas chlororaphis TaxID=587753 RepID=A0A1Q8ER18_9PSED|nr:glycosyltransferase family 2 protein [Pseudomonas chlororaphis]OLF54235.1 glycosyltransferase [Pseudomonas chlororaphis]